MHQLNGCFLSMMRVLTCFRFVSFVYCSSQSGHTSREADAGALSRLRFCSLFVTSSSADAVGLGFLVLPWGALILTPSSRSRHLRDRICFSNSDLEI